MAIVQSSKKKKMPFVTFVYRYNVSIKVVGNLGNKGWPKPLQSTICTLILFCFSHSRKVESSCQNRAVLSKRKLSSFVGAGYGASNSE